MHGRFDDRDPFRLFPFKSSVVTPGLTCMMCQNYEKQLQRLQTECVQVKNRNDVLHMTLKAEKVTKSMSYLVDY